ncbi:MAG: hypothetical protein M1834_005133 [Cirrosporium novae-zelandiae]|nr:MAG: hypothetical protein M1834_005133 [Cirrosporium novae-zelandiae]
MDRKPLRVLCLHGRGGNAEAFEMQTGLLRKRLSDIAEFDFINGRMLWPQAKELRLFFSPEMIYYAHYDPGAPETIHESETLMLNTVKEKGPYDGVMAFSQGCSMAAALMLRLLEKSMFRFAIFLCGSGVDGVKDTLKRQAQRGNDDKNNIKTGVKEVESKSPGLWPTPNDFLSSISTMHVLGGEQDPWIDEGRALYELCGGEAGNTRIWDHGQGHQIPLSMMATRKMETLFRETVDRK